MIMVSCIVLHVHIHRLQHNGMTGRKQTLKLIMSRVFLLFIWVLGLLHLFLLMIRM